MTPEQIKNWKSLLSVMFGPYFLIASEKEICEIAKKFQNRINEEESTLSYSPTKHISQRKPLFTESLVPDDIMKKLRRKYNG